MIPPSDKEVGDPGHTDDHNAITTVLVDHDERLGVVEGVADNAVLVDEPNDVALDNTTNSYHNHVSLPSGDRSGQPDVFGVFRSGERVSAFNGNGYMRVRSNASSDVPFVTQAHSTQSGDLHQWTDFNGAIIARVDSQGNLHGGNVTPTSMIDITLTGDYQWDSTAGNRPRYWQLGNTVELRGALRRQDSNPIEFTGSPILIGSLPPSLGAPGGFRSIQATQQTSSGFFCQIIVSPDGTIRMTGDGAHEPLWVSLDGIRFSRAS